VNPVTDIPPTPLEKLLGYRVQAIALGKEFKENLVRSTINGMWEEKNGDPAYLLPLVDEPEYIPVNATRARAVRMDDREALAEVEEAKKAGADQLANRDKAALENQLLIGRIAELEAKLANLTPDAPKPAAKAAPVAVESTANRTTPDATWTKPELVAYGKAHGITLPSRIDFASKASVLEAILAAETPALVGAAQE
jgi:hypothetical protein